MIPQVVAKYTSSLSTGISKTSTSMTLSSTITRKGETVPTGFYGFVIDRGQENEEVCTGTYNEGVVTFVLRGLSDLDGSTSVEDNKFAHDKGAIVEITAHPALSVMLKTFDTFLDTYQGHWEGAVPTYADLPTGANDGEARITLDDSKIYIWDAETSSWILGGSGGGAGTVYRTTLLGTESTGDDNKTFTLTSGSFPDKKYFQVYKNGVLMVEGATNDYVATGSNQAVFNDEVEDDDVIDLLVISVDLYNPAWNLVDGDILPDVTETHDIGSTTKKFKDGHFSGDVYAERFIAERFIGAIPAGCIMPYAGATAPSGFLLADGSAVSRTTYADLFAVVGETYGIGDGSLTFNLPDLNGRVAVGKSTDTEFNTLGKTGGEKTHQLTVEELASHSHSLNTFHQGSGGHSGLISQSNSSAMPTGSTGSTGGNTAHNNLQPYLTLNYIIKY